MKMCANIGMVFQSFNLFPHLSVLDNCVLAQRRMLKKPKAAARETAMKYLEQVKIPEQRDKFPGQLSGGQQRALPLHGRFASNPKLCCLTSRRRRSTGDGQRGARHNDWAGRNRNDHDLRDT